MGISSPGTLVLPTGPAHSHTATTRTPDLKVGPTRWNGYLFARDARATDRACSLAHGNNPHARPEGLACRMEWVSLRQGRSCYRPGLLTRTRQQPARPT